jgi:hypothetical protein
MVLTKQPFGKKSSVAVVNGDGQAETQDQVVVRDDFWAFLPSRFPGLYPGRRSVAPTGLEVDAASGVRRVPGASLTGGLKIVNVMRKLKGAKRDDGAQLHHAQDAEDLLVG